MYPDSLRSMSRAQSLSNPASIPSIVPTRLLISASRPCQHSPPIQNHQRRIPHRNHIEPLPQDPSIEPCSLGKVRQRLRCIGDAQSSQRQDVQGTVEVEVEVDVAGPGRERPRTTWDEQTVQAEGGENGGREVQSTKPVRDVVVPAWR